MLPVALIALAASFDPTAANASAARGEGGAEDPLPRRGLLPVAAAIVPGLIVHGSGHFVAGDGQGARRLLATQSVGLAAFAAGVAGLSFTGASRRMVVPFEVLTIAGVGTMALTAMAGVYGVSAPHGGLGQASPYTPRLQGSLGSLYVRNPTAPYRWVSGGDLSAWVKRMRFGAQGWSSGDGRTVRAGLSGTYRWRGPRPHGAGDDPQRPTLELTTGTLHHRERRGAVPFDFTTVELTLGGRFGLGGYLGSLDGSFVEWAGGGSVAAYHYGGVASSTEYVDALLLRFGYGFHLGRTSAPHGEVLLAYDHHHDDLAGGLKVPGLGSGPAGSIGVEAQAFFTRQLGVGVTARFGSAHLYGLSLRWRAGGGS